MDISTLNDIVEDLICPICWGEFEDPRVLPCHHYYCANCIDTVCAGRVSFACPECRNIVQVPHVSSREAFPAAFMVNRLKEKLNRNREQCKLAAIQNSNCVDHDCPLKYTCTDCSMRVCPECILTTHKNHSYLDRAVEPSSAAAKSDVPPPIPPRPARVVDSRTKVARPSPSPPPSPVRRERSPCDTVNSQATSPSSCDVKTPPPLPPRKVHRPHSKMEMWYCHVDHSTALRVLRGREDGTFLCRPILINPDPHQTESHNHTIHLMCGENILHIKVLTENSSRKHRLDGQHIMFSALKDLVMYYSEHTFTVDGYHGITLKYPVNDV